MAVQVLHIETWWDAAEAVLGGKCKVLDVSSSHERVKQIRPSKEPTEQKKKC